MAALRIDFFEDTGWWLAAQEKEFFGSVLNNFFGRSFHLVLPFSDRKMVEGRKNIEQCVVALSGLNRSEHVRNEKDERKVERMNHQ